MADIIQLVVIEDHCDACYTVLQSYMKVADKITITQYNRNNLNTNYYAGTIFASVAKVSRSVIAVKRFRIHNMNL